MKENGTLDFCVIGAQKAGTTSLHYHLGKHPGIALPPEKEAPFFSKAETFAKGMDWYIREFFSQALPTQLLGTVTPQYMAYPGVAKKMWLNCPEAKLIAILRDPVDRARSHYKMRVRAFGEQRSFQQVIMDQLEPKSLEQAREQPTPSNSFVIWGEYGRVLSDFLKYYSQDQLLVVFQGDLGNEPGKVLNTIYQFLGLEPVTTDASGKHYNSAKSDSRSPIVITLANAIQNSALRAIGKNLIPAHLKRRLTFWSIINRNVSKKNIGVDASLSSEALAVLSRHYLSDLKELEALGINNVPWRAKIENSIEINK